MHRGTLTKSRPKRHFATAIPKPLPSRILHVKNSPKTKSHRFFQTTMKYIHIYRKKHTATKLHLYMDIYIYIRVCMCVYGKPTLYTLLFWRRSILSVTIATRARSFVRLLVLFAADYLCQGSIRYPTSAQRSFRMGKSTHPLSLTFFVFLIRIVDLRHRVAFWSHLFHLLKSYVHISLF